ncbi:hypothetical protein EV127DRAFT_409538 [Xylaria flabelliformis]|nr:hypothetical protein EV127DRAFT_409538 [Xylaria flabelliformis]
MWEDGWYIGDMADGDAPINQQDNQDDEDVKPDIIDLTNEDEDAERIIIDLTHDDEDGTPVKKETIAVNTEQGAVEREDASARVTVSLLFGGFLQFGVIILHIR